MIILLNPSLARRAFSSMITAQDAHELVSNYAFTTCPDAQINNDGRSDSSLLIAHLLSYASILLSPTTASKYTCTEGGTYCIITNVLVLLKMVTGYNYCCST